MTQNNGIGRDIKVKSILISQPKPESPKSAYYKLTDKYKIRLDFRSFIYVDGISPKDFRKSRIDLSKFGAIIFNSRNAIDHYFRIADAVRYKVPQDTKFFCTSEAIALYLQKYTQYRKRKVFYGEGSIDSFKKLLLKYKPEENILLPCSDIHKKTIPEFLKKSKFKFKEAILYKTLASDLSDLSELKYDIIVFFSPAGVRSLFQNFPDYEQTHARIAAFGPTTAKAVEDAGLYLDIRVPTPSAPSMSMALDKYLSKVNKRKK